MGTTGSARSESVLYRFGPYEVEVDGNELRKFGRRIRLERKPLQLLVTLLEHSGEVLTRSHLQRSVWGEEVFVDFEKGLTVAMAKVRAALNDSAENPKYIETIASEGYRFIAKVERVTASEASRSQPSEGRGTASTFSAPNAKGVDVSPHSTEAWQLRVWKSKAVIATAVVACLFVVVAAKILLRRGPSQPEALPNPKIMLVVLPLENLSGDPSQEYLSDGITEELSTQLGNLNPSALGVIGRTSAMAYKHSSKTISQMGQELAVRYVLEGSVRREGSMLRVTAQLVQVSDQAHVWAQNYDRDVRGLLQVEEEIASDIARQVGVSIALGQPVKFLHPHIPAPEAHEAYLLARFYWNRRTPEGWRMAELTFRRAIEKDPQYSAAYAGLAECLIPRQEAVAAAKKAIELDPASGEARTALGWVEYFKDWDFVAAENALKTAVQLDPNHAPAHHIYSGVLNLEGHLQGAIDEERRAVLLDPLAPIFRIDLAALLSDAGQNDQAMDQIKRVFAIEPRYPKSHEFLGDQYLKGGMYLDAIREFEASERLGGTKLLGLRGYAYARAGDRYRAMRILSELEELEKRSPSGDVSDDLAMVEIGLGNRDAALAWLEREIEQHDSDGPWYALDLIFSPLRSDPRFQELMRRAKLPS